MKLLTPLTGSIGSLLLLTALLPISPVSSTQAVEPVSKRRPVPSDQASPEPKAPARSPEDTLAKGLDYLLAQQHPDGGWGQGGGWRQSSKGGSRVEGANVEDPSDLGNTCVSLVTLLRDGQTPVAGAHQEAAAKAFDFICRQVEAADADSLYVTAVRDTQLQVKIGTYVDTFVAGWALSELKGKVAEGDAETRRATALAKVVAKIEHNQRDDGSFANNNGWAAVLSQGLASRALNSAARSGAPVSKSALDKDGAQNKAGLDVTKGSFDAPTTAAEPSSAGVSLYREAAKLGGLRERVKSNQSRKVEAEKKVADAAAPAPEKQQAEQELKEIAADEKAAQAAGAAVSGKLSDTHYVGGFGNNGGEEFLSYMNLTESMHERGGKEWDNWKQQMNKTVCGAQNADGSWAGQHCITGRTFCTATALLALLVEQNPDGNAVGSLNQSDKPVATTK